MIFFIFNDTVEKNPVFLRDRNLKLICLNNLKIRNLINLGLFQRSLNILLTFLILMIDMNRLLYLHFGTVSKSSDF